MAYLISAVIFACKSCDMQIKNTLDAKMVQEQSETAVYVAICGYKM